MSVLRTNAAIATLTLGTASISGLVDTTKIWSLSAGYNTGATRVRSPIQFDILNYQNDPVFQSSTFWIDDDNTTIARRAFHWLGGMPVTYGPWTARASFYNLNTGTVSIFFSVVTSA